MKASLFAATVNLAIIGVDALRLEKRSEPAVLKIDLLKRAPVIQERSLSKRAGEVGTPDINQGLLYLIQLEIGTPPQTTLVQLDTGSSDLFVETDSSTLCNAASPYNPTPCADFGAYDANNSKTYEYIDSNFIVSYGGGDGGTGDWGSDTVSVGGATLTAVEFGIQYKGDVLEGILGVSYQAIEGRIAFSGEPQYDNFPVLLVKQGLIASRAFSLWTNDDRSSGGTLLFGGVDTAKFSGELVTLDLIASGFDGYADVVDFTLSLKGVTGTDASGNAVAITNGASSMNVLMDSGTTFTYLEDDTVASIWAFVGVDPATGSIPCSQGDTTLIINLEFSGITIPVPMSQLVVFPDSTNTFCSFGIGKGGTNGYIIGDTVLTAMYLVYDLDNNQISMAPTVFDAPTSNILQIMPGPGGVPDSTSATSSAASSSKSSSSSSSSTSKSSSKTSSRTSSSVTTSSRSSSSRTSSTSSPTSGSSKMSSSSSSSKTSSSSSSSKISSSSSSKTSSSSSSFKTSSSSSFSKTSSSSSSSKTSSSSSSKTSSSSSSKITTSISTATTTSSTKSSTTSSSPTSTPTGWNGTPIVGTTINSWTYLGCAAETNPRTLNSPSISGATITIESCQAYCSSNNYGLAGVEYGQECYCGNVLANGGTVGATGCTTPCMGNSLEFCGGSSRLSVFQLTTYGAPASPQVVQNYAYQGCYHEPGQGRLLAGPSYSDTTNMTVESCVSFCASYTPKQTWAGVEYAQECYCATALPAGAAVQPASACNKVCKGNSMEFCGGSSVLNVYEFVAPSVPRDTMREMRSWVA